MHNAGFHICINVEFHVCIKARYHLYLIEKELGKNGRFGCHVASHLHYLTLFCNMKIAIDSTWTSVLIKLYSQNKW